MSRDDPFGLENDAGRTRIRPVRKGAQVSPQPGPAPHAPSSPTPFATSERLREGRENDNPLINAFSPLLGTAPELARATAPDNPDILRERLLDNLTYARDQAVTAGVPLTRADQAAWFVAALLDDVALNTPWGGASGWPRLPLVVSMYGNVDAGERFYDLVEDLLRFRDRDPHLLELAYLCLSLGFRGKHRAPGGEVAITQLRTRIARSLRDRDADPAPLSPHWHGVVAEDEDRRFIVPIWAIALFAVALCAAVYVALGIRLSNRGEQLYTLASVLPPPERAEIFRPVIQQAEDAPPPELPAPVLIGVLPLFAAAAPPDKATALTGREDLSIAVIVIQSTEPEVFRSAKADVNDTYRDLIAAIARTITENAEFIGQVKVVGHTDSVPVQRSNPFQSNQGLSEARARTIADLLIADGVPADRVSHEGRAAADPIADNGTREGRARNRRVEIILQKKV